MNKRQLIVLWVAIGLIVLMGLFPPWVRKEAEYRTYLDAPVGYAFIAVAPDRARVDLSRLFLQWVLVVVAGAGVFWTLRTRKGG